MSERHPGINVGDVIAAGEQFAEAYWKTFAEIGPKHAALAGLIQRNPHWTIPQKWRDSFVGDEGGWTGLKLGDWVELPPELDPRRGQ